MIQTSCPNRPWSESCPNQALNKANWIPDTWILLSGLLLCASKTIEGVQKKRKVNENRLYWTFMNQDFIPYSGILLIFLPGQKKVWHLSAGKPHSDRMQKFPLFGYQIQQSLCHHSKCHTVQRLPKRPPGTEQSNKLATKPTNTSSEQPLIESQLK